MALAAKKKRQAQEQIDRDQTQHLIPFPQHLLRVEGNLLCQQETG
jgi:hypothetical protein